MIAQSAFDLVQYDAILARCVSLVTGDVWFTVSLLRNSRTKVQ